MYGDYLRTILRIQIVRAEEQPAAQLSSARYSGPSESVPSLINDARQGSAQQNAPQRAGAAAISAGGRATGAQPAQGKTATIVRDKEDPFANVGRNDPCPCGSGRKFKKCHGANIS